MGRLLLLFASAVLAAAGSGAAAEPPLAKELLAPLGFDADDLHRMLAGELVEKTLPASSRELAVAFGFLVRQPPAALDRAMVHDALMDRENPDVSQQGELRGDAGPESLAALRLDAGERTLYARPRPGEALNLSDAERALLVSAGGDAAALEAALRRLLLERYRAYRSRGLAGIAPYARADGGETRAGAELGRMSRQLPGIEKADPAFFQLLQSYPEGRPPDLVESFRWSHLVGSTNRALVLTHLFASPLGEGYAYVHREFYASSGFNAGQAVASFLAVQEGTLVLYTNHVSTDQVAGFASGARRAVGEHLMASQLREIFERIQKREAGP